jgi:hypothetical protein
MTHGPEKSDSVVVALKPTNKTARSVAELVEPRTETKGNTNQQSTRRAQDRESVSQALDAYGSPCGEGSRRSSHRSYTTSIPRC